MKAPPKPRQRKGLQAPAATRPSRKARPKGAMKPPGSTIDYSAIEVIPPSTSRVPATMPMPVPRRRKPRINRPFNFTPAQRKLVTELATIGVPQWLIAEQIIGETGEAISVSTLRTHFIDELRAGRRIANTALARSAYMQAVGTPAEYDDAGNCIRAERYPSPTMTIFLCRSRLGYHWGGGINGDDPLEGDGGNGTGVPPSTSGAPAAPLPAVVKEFDLAREMDALTDDELRTLRTILARRVAASAGDEPSDY